MSVGPPQAPTYVLLCFRTSIQIHLLTRSNLATINFGLHNEDLEKTLKTRNKVISRVRQDFWRRGKTFVWAGQLTPC